VDRMTGRVTVFDKELERPVAKDMEIVAAETRGGNSISLEPLTGRPIINSIRAVQVEQNDPAQAVLRIEGDLAGVPVVQKVSLYRGIKRVDLENIVDWKEGRLMKIEQLIPYEHPQAHIRYGVPFGSAAASDIMPNSGPHSGDEMPREQWQHLRQVQDWVFAGTPDWGLTVAVDRQLMILDEGALRIGMLRGTFSTTGFTRDGNPVLIPVPPAAKHVFHYSLCSGKGDWVAARSYRVGLAAGTPLIPVMAEDELSHKSLPPTHSFCSLGAEDLVVTALKKGERDSAVVLRVVEMDGVPAETPVEYLGGRSSFRMANLLEEEARSSEEQTLRLKPFEIRTVRLPVKP
jgi:alpha-mannosidase